MKRIYNYLFPVFLSLFAMAACDGDNEEIVPMSYTDPVATVTKIEPTEGYVGNEFTISGDDFGIRTEDIKVYIGSQEAVVISCADNAIVAKVPESATNGKISVEVFGQHVVTDLSYRVLGKPGVSVVRPSYGFPGASIVFEGQEFLSSKTLYTLTFGTSTEEAEIVGTPTDTEFTAKVPETAVSGVMSLVMADQVIDLASYPFTVLKHATLDIPKEGEPVPSGFAGSTFTIKGTNLVQELLDTSTEELTPLKVNFAKVDGDPVEATIDTENLTDKNIPLTVPTSLEAGEYTVTVITPFETIGTQLKYVVLPMPEVESVTPLKGYVGSKITISGKNFVNTVEDIEVMFGDMSATEVKLEGENNDIIVTVPPLTVFEPVTLSLFVRGIQIDLGENAEFTVNKSPVITTVITDNQFNDKAVQAGNKITIKGTGFQNSGITSATFKDQSLSAVVVSDSEITAEITTEIANNCEMGNGVVTLHFDGVDADIVSTDQLNMLKAGSDISHYVLINGKQPFEAVEEVTGKGHYTPVGWKFNDEFYNGQSSRRPEGLYMNSASDPGLLVIQNSWDNCVTKQNGKMWQTIKLPEGDYDIVLNMVEVNVGNNGRKQAGFFVQKGDDTTLPDIDANRYNWTANADNMIASVNIATGNYENQQLKMENVQVDATVDKVTLGFVVQFANNGHCLKVSSIEIRLK